MRSGANLAAAANTLRHRRAVTRGAMDIPPFEVRIGDATLADPRARIRATRWPEPAPGPPRRRAAAARAGRTLYDVHRWTLPPTGGHLTQIEEAPGRIAGDPGPYVCGIRTRNSSIPKSNAYTS